MTKMTKFIIEVPTELLRQAEKYAALEGESIAALICKYLEEFVAAALEDEEDGREAQEILARIARGEEKVYSWEEVEAELNGLPR